MMKTALHGNSTQTGRSGNKVGVEHALVEEVTPRGSSDPAYRGLQRLLLLMSCNSGQIRLDMPILRCFLFLFFGSPPSGFWAPMPRGQEKKQTLSVKLKVQCVQF